MDTSSHLICRHTKVLSFYKNHPNLDFETMNVLFVDFMENLTQDIHSSLSNNIASQLLENMRALQSQIGGVTDHVGKIHADMVHQLGSKLNECKREYVEDVKMILSSNTSDKIAPLIKESNNALLDKSFIMMSEVVPKHNEQLTRQIQDHMKSFHAQMAEDTNTFLKRSVNQKSLDDFVSSMDAKFVTAITNTQQILNSMIGATEQRLDSRINDIKTSTEKHILDIKQISTANQSSQNTLQTNVGELLKKMENSHSKGQFSENILIHMLHSLYPSAQIDYVGNVKESCDVMLTRKNKPKILIENKNWGKNVSQDEVKKFIHDVELHKCSGLFLSQNYGVANKDNFEINIHNNNVLLYVHEVNNDAEKIKIAIDVIDGFKIKLDEYALMSSETGNDHVIDNDTLEELNKEYQLYNTQRLAQVKNLKEYYQKSLRFLDTIPMPLFEKYLSTRFAFATTKGQPNVCECCQFVAKNKQALSAHKRGCKGKPIPVLESDEEECEA